MNAKWLSGLFEPSVDGRRFRGRFTKRSLFLGATSLRFAVVRLTKQEQAKFLLLYLGYLLHVAEAQDAALATARVRGLTSLRVRKS